MRDSTTLLRRLLLACALLVGLPVALAAQAGTVRGIVTDSSGRAMPGVEVLAILQQKSVRTDNQGRFIIRGLPWGQVVVMARSPGWKAQEQVAMVDDGGAQRELIFAMTRAVQLIDTLRIVSQDGCAPYRFEGFECRRRAGIGQFRGPEELAAIKPDYWADMFEGMEGIRREPWMDRQRGRLDWTVASTAGWRCLTEGFNGRERTAREEIIYAEQIYAVEYFDVYERVPEAYKRLAWPRQMSQPCSLVMYWTKVWVEENGGPPARR
ncbi:MAG: carboxypeptidase regulatory-like domain-containing protein [Gemmatimonadaceae bacterium]|nr:carboxypeptidase regulatory-like domain-containing protein [Gemmatimonadaceae bacterium]MCW5826347.1 carboxypeptidase regulatory-like domain-containing protein [Gemmatimonadaceae bacterium]